MQKAETKHRKYQVLKWIDALERGYPGHDHYPPTASNLALHMIEAGVREDALSNKFGWGALRKPYNPEMVNYMKSYLQTVISRYEMRLFRLRDIVKSERNTYALEIGLEDEKMQSGYRVKAYFLSSRGRNELADLEDMARQHHEMTPRTYRQDSVDKLVLPKREGRGSWWTSEQVLRKGTGV